MDSKDALQVVTHRLPRKVIEKLDRITAEERYYSRSELIRQLLTCSLETLHGEDETERISVPIKCTNCGVVFEGSTFLGVAGKIVIECAKCKHKAALNEFRKETPGYNGI